MTSYLLVAGERKGVADVVGHELTPDRGQRGHVLVGVVVGPEQLRRDGERVQQLAAERAGRARDPHAVLVLRGHDAEVGRPRHAPHGVLDVVALAVGRAVLLREAEGGLDVRADLGEHRVLDRDALDLGRDLGPAQGEAGTMKRYRGLKLSARTICRFADTRLRLNFKGNKVVESELNRYLIWLH